MGFYKSPEIESNWWRIFLYLLLCISASFLFSIPVMPFFIDSIQENIKDVLANDPYYKSATQLAMALGIGAASWLMIKQIEYRTFAFYRLTVDRLSLLKGFVTGVSVIAFFAFLVYTLGIVEFEYVGISMKLLVSFFIYTLVSICEEVLVRGYILTNLQEKMNPFFAVIISSLFFGILHLGNQHFTWIGFTTISLSGFLMGLLTLKTGSISTAVGLHWSWNFIQGAVLGFAVSGHQEIGILNPIARTTATYTGGEFGAEGSVLLMTLSLLIAVAACYFLFDKKFLFGSKRVFTNPEFSEEK